MKVRDEPHLDHSTSLGEGVVGTGDVGEKASRASVRDVQNAQGDGPSPTPSDQKAESSVESKIFVDEIRVRTL